MYPQLLHSNLFCSRLGEGSLTLDSESFSEIDGTIFACPVCRAGKNLYKDIGPREKPSGFEENLTYGFGFNSLPPGQKNILIFGGLAFAAACFLSLYSLH